VKKQVNSLSTSTRTGNSSGGAIVEETKRAAILRGPGKKSPPGFRNKLTNEGRNGGTEKRKAVSCLIEDSAMKAGLRTLAPPLTKKKNSPKKQSYT